MQRLSRKWAKGALSVFLAATLILTGCGGKEQNESSTDQNPNQEFKPLSTTSKKVVAEYQGGKVMEGELNRYTNIVAFLDPQLAMMLSTLQGKENQIMVELAKEYAARKYIVAKNGNSGEAEKQADQTMKDYEEQFKKSSSSGEGNMPKSLDEAIKGKGFTKDELRAFFVDYYKMDAYYNQQLKGKTYTHVKVHHILVAVNEGDQASPDQPKRSDADAKKRAEEVKAKLEKTGDFKKLAKEYSDDPGSKDSEGLIDGPADMFVPEFAKAAKTLPLNKISDPIKTDYGYHVMKVVDRKEADLEKAPDEVKNPKKQEIFDQIVKNELKFKSLIGQAKK